jgi:riboflavin synthase
LCTVHLELSFEPSAATRLFRVHTNKEKGIVFTGLIEELGTLVDRKTEGTSVRLQIEAQKVLSDLKIDDSISINGCCQTVVRIEASAFEVIAVRETLQKTTLGSLKIGAALNLERAATLETRLGGHLVQGHVDGRASLKEIRALDGSWEYYFEIPEAFIRYIVPVGSIAINGVSLTVANIEARTIKVAIIPHTHAVTNFKDLHPGDEVNIETDVIAKMVEQFVERRTE